MRNKDFRVTKDIKDLKDLKDLKDINDPKDYIFNCPFSIFYFEL